MSRLGKEILIKTVAHAIPIYMMSIFHIPDGLIDEIHVVLAKFLWGNKGSSMSMHWHSWDKLCMPKAMRGLDF